MEMMAFTFLNLQTGSTNNNQYPLLANKVLPVMIRMINYRGNFQLFHGDLCHDWLWSANRFRIATHLKINLPHPIYYRATKGGIPTAAIIKQK